MRSLFLIVLAAACTAPADSTPLSPRSADEPGAVPVDEEAPTVQVAISPQRPIAGEDLSCAAVDADGLHVTYRWEVDGADAGVTGATVPGYRLTGDTSWTCIAEVWGEEAGVATVDVDEACASHLADGLVWRAFSAELDLRASPFTVSAWTYLDQPVDIPAGLGVHMVVVGRTDSAAYDDAHTDWMLRFDGTEELEFVTGEGDSCAVLAVPAPPSGGWHHLSGTYDPRTRSKQLFVDGELVASCKSASRPRLAYGSAEVGGHRERGMVHDRFEGWIDEVHVERQVLWTGDFTPPTYPKATPDTAWLLHFDDAREVPDGPVMVFGIPDASRAGLHAETVVGMDVSETHSSCDVAGG